MNETAVARCSNTNRKVTGRRCSFEGVKAINATRQRPVLALVMGTTSTFHFLRIYTDPKYHINGSESSSNADKSIEKPPAHTTSQNLSTSQILHGIDQTPSSTRDGEGRHLCAAFTAPRAHEEAQGRHIWYAMVTQSSRTAN